MQRGKYLILVIFAALFSACDKGEPVPDTPILLLQSVVTSDRVTELQRITTTFTYNENDLLIERRREDTTFYKSTDTFLASQRTISYTYGGDGLLSKSVQSIVSLTDFRIVESNFSYRNGVLVSEKIGEVINNYSYDEAGELSRTETVYPWGRTTATEYRNGVPLIYQAVGNGFVSISDDVKSYYNTDLQLIKREQLDAGRIISVEERSYHAGKSYYDALPNFKGFPYVKSEAYGEGIRDTKQIYSIENSQRILIEEERFIPIFDANGFLIKNEGVDRFRLDTPSPGANSVIYQYKYSR